MRHVVPALMLLTLTGCIGDPLFPPSGSSTAAASASAGPIGALQFTPITAQNAQYAGGAGVASGTAAVPAATGPVPAPNGVSVAGGGPAQATGQFSGNMNGGYYPFGPAYGSGGPTTLVSLTQAETTGSRGPYLSVMSTIVAPIIKAWASDAQLLSVTGQTDGSGLLDEASPSPAPTPCGPVYGPTADTGWRFTYTSASRNESLSFVVTAAKTVIVRSRWAPLDLATADVQVDNSVAIQSLVTAITTQGYQSEEEKTGKDYFLGTPYNAPCLYPMPMPMASGAAKQNYTEVVYAVPQDARWNATLQVELGKPVWVLNFYAQQQKATTGPQDYYFNNAANGYVDARTGAVIRFSRPTRQHFAVPMPGPSIPAPEPSVTRSSAPTPQPTVPTSPGPSVSASPSTGPTPQPTPTPSATPTSQQQ